MRVHLDMGEKPSLKNLFSQQSFVDENGKPIPIYSRIQALNHMCDVLGWELADSYTTVSSRAILYHYLLKLPKTCTP